MATETAGQKEQAVAYPMVLLFELEYLALAGRKRLFELLKKNLSTAGVQLSPALFSRFGLAAAPEFAVAGILEGAGGKGDAARIGADIADTFAADLKEKVEPVAPVVKLVQAALKKGCAVGAVSALGEDDAQAALQRLALGVEIKLAAHKPTEAAYPRAETWAKLLKSACKSTVPAVAVVSSAASARAALAAGLRCIVVTDEFTGHQDFGGADLIIDTATDLNASDVFATLGLK